MLILAGVLLSASVAAAQNVVRVKDIAPGPEGSSVDKLVDVGGAACFVADDGSHGPELWRSDGTEAGTVLVKDIKPGPGGSSPAWIVGLQNAAFFAADDGTSGIELWKSDGTPAGTVLVKDIFPGSASSTPSDAAVFGGVLYFFADDGVAGRELWKSDGTPAGTVQVKDIRPGSPGSTPTDDYGQPISFAAVPAADRIYFMADDGVNGTEIWNSDGTEQGTVLLKDIVPGPAGSGVGYGGAELRPAGNLVFFLAKDLSVGERLWRTDGTAAGTISLSPTGDYSHVTTVGRRVFFAGYYGGGPFGPIEAVWTSDGTPEGTLSLKDVSYLGNLTAMGGLLFFTESAGLWKSDGSISGTVRVRSFPSGYCIGRYCFPGAGSVGEGHGRLYFSGKDDEAGSELWTSDGSGEGTVRIADINPGSASSAPRPLRTSEPGLFFAADDGSSGQELWLFPIPAATVDDRGVQEGAAMNAVFRVTLSRPFAYTATVSYQTNDGTAQAASDYTSTSGMLTFTPGRTWHSIAVPVLTDGVTEGTETFTLTLTASAGARLARAAATGTIDDPPPPANVPMYRAYNVTADYHFFTTSLPEKNNAVANGYRDESTPLPFQVSNVMQPGASAINRMYNPNAGRHYYTASAGERDVLRGLGWAYEKDEGFLFPGPAPGTTEIFRLYNINSGVHLYTASASEKEAILASFPGIWVQHTSLGYAYPP